MILVSLHVRQDSSHLSRHLVFSALSLNPDSHFVQVVASVHFIQSARQLVHVSLFVAELRVLKNPSLHAVQLLISEIEQPKHPVTH